MKSIRWIHQILLDGKPASLEIMVGVNSIADRCYIRVNNDQEVWFHAQSSIRAEIIQQGLELLKQRLEGHSATNLDHTPFTWSEA